MEKDNPELYYILYVRWRFPPPPRPPPKMRLVGHEHA